MEFHKIDNQKITCRFSKVIRFTKKSVLFDRLRERLLQIGVEQLEGNQIGLRVQLDGVLLFQLNDVLLYELIGAERKAKRQI